MTDDGHELGLVRGLTHTDAIETTCRLQREENISKPAYEPRGSNEKAWPCTLNSSADASFKYCLFVSVEHFQVYAKDRTAVTQELLVMAAAQRHVPPPSAVGPC